MCKCTLIVVICVFFSTVHTVAAVQIVGSRHDLTASGIGAVKIPGLIEPCYACHGGAHNWLPGGAGMGRFLRPVTQVYSSPTLKHGNTVYNLASANASDAPLCLSCHDGSLASSSGYEYLSSLPASANLGSDLSNDHPVGFDYNPDFDTVGLKSATVARVNFGKSRKAIWCSTCHNVHDSTFEKFLVMDNAGSALCLDCHKK